LAGRLAAAALTAGLAGSDSVAAPEGAPAPAGPTAGEIEACVPADTRGSALLLIEKPGRNDMFMYLPELKRTRRVTGPGLSGGMFGTDFTDSQFERLQGVARDLHVERMPDAELDGAPVRVLAHTPGDDPEFESVLSYIDPDRPIHRKMFNPSNLAQGK